MTAICTCYSPSASCNTCFAIISFVNISCICIKSKQLLSLWALSFNPFWHHKTLDLAIVENSEVIGANIFGQDDYYYELLCFVGTASSLWYAYGRYSSHDYWLWTSFVYCSVMSVDTVLSTLLSNHMITDIEVSNVKEFVAGNQITTTSVIDPLEDIVLRLHDIGSFRFGSFKLSNGMITPIYVDLRLVISHPALMVGSFFWNIIIDASLIIKHQ